MTVQDLSIKYPGLEMSIDGYTYKGYDIILGKIYPKHFRVELNGVSIDAYQELEGCIKYIISLNGKAPAVGINICGGW